MCYGNTNILIAATLYDKARWVLSRVGKTANDSFTFIIENPPAAWSDFITYVNNHRTKFGIACALIIGSVLIIVVTLPVGLVLAGPILGTFLHSRCAPIFSVVYGMLTRGRFHYGSMAVIGQGCANKHFICDAAATRDGGVFYGGWARVD